MAFKQWFAVVAALGLSVHTIQAVVATPPLPSGMVGSFEGLLRVGGDAGGAPSGKVELAVLATGKFTGKLTLTDDAKVYPLTGTLLISGDSSYASVASGLTLSRGTTKAALNLALKVSSASALESTLSVPADAGFEPRLTTAGIRVKTYAVADPVCAWMGTYTLALANPVIVAPGAPAGEGYASVTIDKKGVLKYTGKLADGSKITGSLNPAADMSYRWFLKPYTTVGSYFAGRMVLSARPDSKYHVAGVSGVTVSDVYWQKIANSKDKVYPSGFGPISLLPLMEPYTPPAKNAVIGGPTDAPLSKTQKFSVTLSGAGLPDAAFNSTLPSQVRLNATQSLIVANGQTGSPSPLAQAAWTKIWTGKVTPATGVFTGTFTLNHLDTKGKTVSRKVPFEGVILQFQNSSGWAFGQGFYLVPPKVGDTVVTTTLSGRITFSNPVNDPISSLAGTYAVTLTEDLDTTYVTRLTAGVPSLTKPAVLIIADDLSSATFNGKKVPLMTDSRPVDIIFSNFFSSPLNYLLVTIVLDGQGRPYDFSAEYVKSSIKGDISGASFSANQPQIVKVP